MPVYVARCEQCKKEQDYIRPVSQYLDTPECCGKSMKKIIVPVTVFEDLPEYISPITGKPVNGRKARKDDLARHNCVEVDPSASRSRSKENEYRKRWGTDPI